MKVAVTGGAGFLGWHVRCALRRLGHDAVSVDRDVFADDTALRAAVSAADVVFHCAGVNRAATDAEVADGNRRLADRLVWALSEAGVAPAVVYTNSTKSEVGGVYGEAKQSAAISLERWATSVGARFVDLVLPHLFGEYGRPNYNSAVTTFAHNLAVGEPSGVVREGQLELAHAQDVAATMLELADGAGRVRHRLDGRRITVGEVFDLMSEQYRRYVEERVVPSFADRFELQVFNTLRSQLFLQGHYPVALTLHEDARGGFAELMRADGVGQTSISTTVPGVTRGDHYHLDKIERFVVVAGSARLRLRRLLTEEVIEFDVVGDVPVAIDMPPLTTHNITNTGDGIMTTVFWAGDHFDPAAPDTYAEAVEMFS